MCLSVAYINELKQRFIAHVLSLFKVTPLQIMSLLVDRY